MEIYVCPKCKRRAERCIAPNFLPISWGITAERLDLPYFLCLRCNLVGADWALIKSHFSSLYRRRSNKKRHCFHALYREVRDAMETIIDERKNRFGGKDAKFEKQSHER